ncbi:chemotaxis protein CheW [Cellulosilyticum ruminicola]|uniref:chemotaxis protein CheW n=1 Tax=Cellulosilyticum ruminicola TaxID=425254 RepID=UPI0006D090C2|nr:chemotaxis protein CheW [Cellulosilyticum ruminicola]
MTTKQIVVFQLQGQKFGIDIMSVLEILNYSTIRTVPEVPSYIQGIINVRGTVYPIVNLCTRLGLEAFKDESSCQFILLNLEDVRVGFMVDKVLEILTIETKDVEQGPQITEVDKVSCVNGIIKEQEHIILLLDIDILISESKQIVLK